MSRYGKWLIGGLGFATSGPIGGILGFVIGSIVDKVITFGESVQGDEGLRQRTRNDYIVSLTVLTAAVLKADGKVLKSELDFVKLYFSRSFGQESSEEAILMLRDILKQDIPVDSVADQVARNIGIEGRVQLIHFLYGVANADGVIDESEKLLIQRIAYRFRISREDLASVEAMYIKVTDWAYVVLEVPMEVSNEEVKKAYRKMAVKFHPDKVSHLGLEAQEAAKEKFQKLSEAYDTIKSERGMV